MAYKHSEIGWFFIGIMLLSLGIVTAGHFWVQEIGLAAFATILGSITVAALLFYKLTITVNNNVILLTYGIGIIRITLDTAHIASVEVTKTPWYYGLGIRFSPLGKIYNIHSLSAVKLQYTKNGTAKTIFIGTPEPEAVLRAIEERR